MNAKRMLYTSSIAAGIGLAGLLGTGIATANAAPAPSNSGSSAAGQQSGPTVKLDHHQRKEVGKQAEKQAKGKQEVTPATSSHR
ncbi:MAG TPA: hypothetical protein VEF72_05785 [Mycobacterium sp.]|jgi:hypothetical protein|nr:hypothetical protein [Mycobacterium sp.]